MKKLKNKKLLIILGSILLGALLIAGLLIIKQKHFYSLSSKSEHSNSQNSSKSLTKNSVVLPAFLSVKEKEKLGVSPKLKIQALKRNSSGQIMVYKIIGTSTNK